MEIETIRRVSLARHLFELATSSLRSKNDLHLFAAVNLAQDAVEAFLIALADHLHVAFDQNTKFDKYFSLIDERIKPSELPFRAKLLRLNRLRVDSKHHGIQPARDECERLITSAQEFMDEASSTHFGAPFATISAIDLLEETESRQHLAEAKLSLENGNREACVISCRKAIYAEVERYYDISAYIDGEPKGMLAAETSAPYYARSKDYIDKHVNDPTDYIVLDHAAVDRDLLTRGVDPTDFWNVWRLTPEVFKAKDGAWYVRREFSKVDPVALIENASYVFAAALDVVLSIHTHRRSVRTQTFNRYYVELARSDVPVYAKADRTSPITITVPSGLSRLDANFSVPGLNDEGPYWYVFHFGNGNFISGFIHNDDVARSEG